MTEQNEDQRPPNSHDSIQDHLSSFFQENFKNLKSNLWILISFLKDPVLGMKHLPPWTVRETVFLHGLLAATSGLLGGVFSLQLFYLFFGLLIFPLTIIISSVIFSGFFYYLILFIFRKQPNFFLIYKIHFLAQLPILIVATMTPFLPPMALLGTAGSFFLLYIGLVEQFQVPKKLLARILLFFFVAYLLLWIWNLVEQNSSKEAHRYKALPKSLDILEKELNDF